ncbi:MAG: long-chain-fatty-acid--CoA ligase [Deltaproteobacteria bacterium]|nr:long-chain-fatty-acid--CoA ligase [Deltaproteobacteria bacterium]
MRVYYDSLGDTLRLTAGKYPDKIAVVNYGESRFTYCELNERVNKLANTFREMGISKGDKVAYLFFNCSQFLEVHYAVAKTGAVGVPLNFRLIGKELSYQLNNSDAVCIVYGPEFVETVNSIRHEIPNIKYYICDGDGDDSTLIYEKVIASGSPDEPNVDVTLYDDFIIMYTSGTTGLPKGTVLTHKNNFLGNIEIALDYRFKRSDILQIVPPLYHLASLTFSGMALILGQTLIIHKQVNPQEMLQAIPDEKITFSWGPGTLWNMLINYPDFEKYDVSSVRLIINGGMTMPSELRQKVLDKFPNAELGDTYGLTETSVGVSILPPEDALRKSASVGVPLVFSDVRIFNDHGEELPPNVVGEIVSAGNFMKGYYKNEKATAEAIKKGWFCTGDLGMKDEEGFIYLVDRKKDMISTGGENVYSKEVEDVIYGYPDVLEVAIIGTPDEKWGEVVTAVIVPKTGKAIVEEDFIKYCRSNMASYKCPKIIKFTESIPKNPSGKILKRELREIYANA